jgi:hypothetical protein
VGRDVDVTVREHAVDEVFLADPVGFPVDSSPASIAPEPAGPPGLTSSTPRRFATLVLACFETSTFIRAPSGRD